MNSGGNGFGQPRRARVQCPFYGFAWPPATPRLMHEPGNRCGLALDRVEPCAMEQADQPVNIKQCRLAKALAHFIRSASPVIAFVTPEHPDGVPYSAWWRRTMAQRDCNRDI